MSKRILPYNSVISIIASLSLIMFFVAPVVMNSTSGSLNSSLISMSAQAQSTALSLDSIGTSSTAGKSFTEWTYIGENPILTGTATAGEAVTIKINDVSHVVMTDDTGSWTFTSTDLTVGDHVINISTEDGGSYLFTLHVVDSSTTTTDTATTSGTTDTKGGTDSAVVLPETLPNSGAFDSTIGLFVIGSIMIGISMVTKAQFSEITNDIED